MRRYFLCCLASAMMGAVAALSLSDGSFAGRLGAQEPGRAAGFTGEGALAATGPSAAVTRLPQDDLTPEERVNVDVYERLNRSVVNIKTEGVRADAFFFIDIPSQGMGSGSVLDKSGHVLTNYHVIEGAREIEVALFNGNAFPAQLVGADSLSDLAVLRIEAPADALYPVRIGDSTQLRVGQRVFAIGNPFGLERTLTTGIVSSLNRSLPTRHHQRLRSMIQIDAAINPGNSGGPLLDSHGRLIGMNTAIASKTGQSTGVGFAIPASTISRNVPQLIEKGRVIRPDVGIVRVYETEQGLLVASLAPGGPAEQAGMRGPQLRRERRKQGPFNYEYQQIDRAAADLIVGVDGNRITTADQFLSAIDSKQPGDVVVIAVVRQGQEMNVRVRLLESPP